MRLGSVGSGLFSKNQIPRVQKLKIVDDFLTLSLVIHVAKWLDVSKILKFFTMNSIRLCSTGDVLTIWEGSGYNPVHTFSPTSGVRKIISSSWSYDGSCVASCVEGSDKILITDVKSTSCMTVDVDTVLGVNPIRVQYPRTSLKLLIVGSTDKVIFNLLS